MIQKFLDYLRFSAKQVNRKRMRVLLTALGIAIGIAAVIGTVSLGEGIRYQAVNAIQAQSDLTLIEVSADVRDGTVQYITAAKTAQIASISDVTSSAPVLRDAWASERQTYLGVMGVGAEEIAGVIDPEYMTGRAFAASSREVVLGHDLAEKLRRYEGMRLDEPFRVVVRQYDETGMPEDQRLDLIPVGVLQERGDQFDNLMLTDMSLVRDIRDAGGISDSVLVRVNSPAAVGGVVSEVLALGLAANGAFEEIESVNRLMDLVVLMLAFFAGVSLIVGALMIVNTMITSIYERIGEIGITMAVGASPADVVSLILFECLYIGLIGGIIGDLLGIAFSGLINLVGKPFVIAQLGEAFAGFESADITIITPGMLVMGILIAVVLSLLSGIYPALKASRLNPVDAIASAR